MKTVSIPGGRARIAATALVQRAVSSVTTTSRRCSTFGEKNPRVDQAQRLEGRPVRGQPPCGGGRSIPIDCSMVARKTSSVALGKRCGRTRSVSDPIPTIPTVPRAPRPQPTWPAIRAGELRPTAQASSGRRRRRRRPPRPCELRTASSARGPAGRPRPRRARRRERVRVTGTAALPEAGRRKAKPVPDPCGAAGDEQRDRDRDEDGSARQMRHSGSGT